MEPKKLAGEKAVDYIENNMVIGLGTGSTVYWTIRHLALRVKAGLHIKAIPTSMSTARLAEQLGIPLASFTEIDRLDLTIDGADEVSPDLNLIKGGGGALLREKIVAYASERLIIVADSSKQVASLGKFPLPVEITPFGWENTCKQVMLLGCESLTLREKDERPFVTDNGNYIADCKFGRIDSPDLLEKSLNAIPGVVENGLFVNMADQVIIGTEKGTNIVEK
ncbi:ribose-5-phosphate isomerase RpiA [Pseudalkalibacillus caeni]|uniref:Ribose-5-phosphate isomerase A n=1 Tax=Exobacillus caeni TaxID=2574798 RepID=A0A5R9FBN0_9BACL|nr:ribose-5-phosphate isomerase RpiA [Pseudalkalibacillus caeni]TLS37954.1 ribose-5-phosphate isomerase RpiA [Pseudalkalibacillus caeni]